MTEKATTPGDLLDLPLRDFLSQVQAWMKAEYPGKYLEVGTIHDCPLQKWVIHNNCTCAKGLVPNIAKCPICGNQCCPGCYNHAVDVVSRVTGYLQTVSGWNTAKKQEFEDRHRYDIGGERPV